MKPDWDKLMKKYKDHETVLIADVDCTAAGKDLCTEVGVKGYPTLKHGDPSALEDYSGGRTYKDLEKFAGTLKPGCSPANIDLCSDEKKAEIEALNAMDLAALKKDIKEGEKEIEAAEKDFKAEVEKLQAQYKKLMEDKDAKVEEIKAAGLGLKKSVLAARKKANKAKKKAEREARKKEESKKRIINSLYVKK